MSTQTKSPRKTPHKQRNIVQQDDEKLLDESLEEKPKKVVEQKNRRKSTISHRNVPEEIIEIFDDEKAEKLAKNSKQELDPTCWVEASFESSDSKESTKKQDLEKTPTKKPTRNTRHRTPSSKALENVAADSSPSCELIETRKTRKSGRFRSPTKRLIEGESTKSKKKEKVLDSSSSSSNDESVEKPSTELFVDGDVEGHHLFGFKTPKKKTGLAAVKTPKTPNLFGTPKREKILLNPKTPHHLRVKTKKRKFFQKI